jgi:ABC-type transport system involved in multi-copper enzyme maturation permease subunit
LTHTLPVEKKTLYLSKFLTSIITLLTSFGIIVLSFFVAYGKEMIDFISGAAYALGVSIKKATNDSFFIAPRDVDVSGGVFDSDDGDDEFFTV